MKKILCGLMICIMTIFTAFPSVSAETYVSTNWDALVKAMKSEEVVSSFKKQFEDEIDVTVTSDANNINYLIKNVNTNKEYNVKITQYNGIARFATTNDMNNIDVDLAEYERIINILFMLESANIYGYEKEEFYEWLSSVDLTTTNVNDDGLELELYEFIVYETDEDGSKIEVTYERLKSLAMNIDCGISAFTNYVPEDSTEPENPTQPSEPSNPTEPEVDPEPETKPEESEPTPDEPKDEEVKDEDVKEETKEEVKHEVTPEEDKETTVENPPTSLYTSFGIIGVAIISLIVFMVSRKKTYFSKI